MTLFKPYHTFNCLYCSKSLKRKAGEIMNHNESDHSLAIYAYGTTDYEVYLDKTNKINFESEFNRPFHNIYKMKREDWCSNWLIGSMFKINKTNKDWSIHQWMDFIKNDFILK